MIALTIENIGELQRRFDPADVLKALDRSIKTASARVSTGISRDVRVRYNIKASDIAKAVTVKPVYTGEIVSRLLVYVGRRVTLRKFGANKRRVNKGLGVSVLVRKDNGRKIVQGGFMALGLNARPGETPEQIFKRNGVPRRMRKGTYIGRKKQPLVRLTGPSIPTMVQQKDVIDKASDLAGEVVRREFTRQMNLLLQRTGAQP